VKMKDEVFAGNPVVASTIVQIERLAFPELLVEIRCVAKL
jgi:2-iminobutanoate/2-iminopropanoate deaminase